MLLVLLLLISLMRETATVYLKSRCQNYFHGFLLHSCFGDILGRKLLEMFFFLSLSLCFSGPGVVLTRASGVWALTLLCESCPICPPPRAV